jgi:hypothetical protein
MKKLSDKPLFNPSHPENSKYRNRAKKILSVGVLAVTSLFILAKSGDHQTHQKDTVPHVVRGGETEWSIASGESTKTAYDAEALHAAIQDIDRQTKKHTLIQGELVMLPQGSKNSNTAVGNIDSVSK